jgi:small-conductance mechanosensitive channel/phosphatidylglycerophosphate synthase
MVRDSWLDRVFHRRLSQPVSQLAIRVGASPNQVTLASLAVGLAGAWTLAGGGARRGVIGLGLYLAAVVLDHADGEVARLTGTMSRVGHWLDIAADTAVHATLVLAMGVAAGRLGEGSGPWLGALAAAGVIASAAAASLWPLDPAAGPRTGLARALDGMGNRHGFYALLLAFVVASAWAPGLLPALLVVVAIGSHVYWAGRVLVGAVARGHAGVRGAALAVAVLLASLAHAEDKAPKLPEPLTKDAIRELVARLSDTEVRQLLIAQLDRAAKPAPAAGGGDMMGMVQGVAGGSAMVRARGGELVRGLGALPAALAEVRATFLEGRGPGHLGLVLLGFVVTLGVGTLVERLARRTLGRPAAALIPAPTGRLATEVTRFVMSLAIELLALIVFAAGVVATFLVVHQGHVPSRQLVLTLLAAVVLVRVVAVISRALLAPADPSARLLPFDDLAARRLHGGVVRLAVVYAFGGGILGFLSGLGLPAATRDVLGVLLTLVFLALALDLVWRVRADVARLIRGPAPGPLRRLIADGWPVLASAYLLAVVATRIWEVLTGTAGASRAPILSVVLLLALPLADMFLCRLLGALLFQRAGADGSTRATFEPVVRRAVHVVVSVVGLLLLADLWQVDLLNLAERGLGGRISGALFGVAISLLLAWIAWEAARTAIDHRLSREGGPGAGERGEEGGGAPASRLRTLLPLLRGTVLVTIVLMGALSVLSALGVNIVPLLAGAGVFGLAIGFGSQTLVRDVVSGAFFLIDDAFRLGEYIEAGDVKGTVERITIRSLQVRHHRGALNIVPYGEIKRLRNTSRDWMIMTLEFRLTYDTDLIRVKKIIRRIGEELAADPELGPELLQPLKSQGVMATEDSALLVRAKFMARPGAAPYVIRREAYQRILKAFAAEGVHFAHRQVTVFTAGEEGTSPPAAPGRAAAAAALATESPAAKPAT